ncbi:MAG: beta-N-acetylhexosaminidase [Clostridia bacterium]|nr:beta-N-acetylhexosaminidase [Clostridia bacterium]
MKLIPVPKKITEKSGALDLSGLDVAVKYPSDGRLAARATDLKEDLEAATGKVIRLYAAPTAPEAKAIFVEDLGGCSEAYTLEVTKGGVHITGDSAAGAFYGMQTLRQMIKEYGASLPLCKIEDEPSFPERGFYHDITRGRVPTLEKLKQIAKQLSFYKINELQLYVEDAFAFREFDGIVTADECLTAAEITELDDFCHAHFIELVPSLSTFGHLYRLLQSDKYRHLCEYEDWHPWQIYWLEKMAHHTIDVSNPESIELIKSLIDQYVPLFRSNKFNICCDETFDLCRGRNTGKDEGEEYFKFVSKIIAHVKSYGKTVQMWGDIVLNHPEKMNLLPPDTVMLNWNYEKAANEKNVKTFAASGMTQVVCPGTSSWNRFVEEIDRSFGNISSLAKYGFENGAKGLINTNWGDFGNICAWSCEMYGMVIGAERAWNPVGEIGEEFELAASNLLYGVRDRNMVRLVYDLGQAERSCDWMLFVYWYSANTKEGRKTELEVDVDRCRANITRADEILYEFIEAGDPADPVFVDLKLAARAVKLMNKVHLMIKGEEDFQDRVSLKAEWAEWFREYRIAWLRDDKPSQIELIGEFLDSITTLF